MIGWFVDALLEHVVAPQNTTAVPEERRLELVAQDLLVGRGGITVSQSTSAPIAGRSLIGGGGQLRHVVSLVVQVTDADLERATATRDAVVTDLVLRMMPGYGDPTLGQAEGPAASQELERVDWDVQYADQSGGTVLAAFAVLTITATVDWYPARVPA